MILCRHPKVSQQLCQEQEPWQCLCRAGNDLLHMSPRLLVTVQGKHQSQHNIYPWDGRNIPHLRPIFCPLAALQTYSISIHHKDFHRARAMLCPQLKQGSGPTIRLKHSCLTKTENETDQLQTLQKSFQHLALTGRSFNCGDKFSSLQLMTPFNSYPLLYRQFAMSKASDRSLVMALGMWC